MYRKEAFMTLDSLLARGRTRSTHVTEGYVCGSARGVLACGEDAKEEESVSACARVRERRENIQRERGVGADARAAVPSDKCLDCQSGATSRPPRREDHACGGSDSSSNSLVVTWNGGGGRATDAARERDGTRMVRKRRSGCSQVSSCPSHGCSTYDHYKVTRYSKGSWHSDTCERMRGRARVRSRAVT